MFNIICNTITRKIIDENDYDRIDIYTYGIELLLSLLLGSATILLTAYLLNSIHLGITFLLTFIPIRMFCGGYHAKTYINCWLISNMLHLLLLIFISIVPISLIQPLTLVLITTSCPYIYKNSPVLHPNHPVSPAVIKKNQAICSKLITVLFSLVNTINLLYTSRILLCIATSTLFIALFMLIEKKSHNKY